MGTVTHFKAGFETNTWWVGPSCWFWCHIWFQSNNFTTNQFDCCYWLCHSCPFNMRDLVMEINPNYTCHTEPFLLSWRGNVTASRFMAEIWSAIGSELPESDIHHKSSSSFKWNVFTLQLGSISCGALCSDSQLLTHPPQHVQCGLR